jgi:hypothetical protein
MIKKQQLILSAILIAVSFIFACAAGKSTFQSEFVIGEVVVIGNEPFTNLALRTYPLNTFILDCNKENRNFLLNNQGKTAKIYYENIDSTKIPNVIYVQKCEIITKEIQ